MTARSAELLDMIQACGGRIVTAGRRLRVVTPEELPSDIVNDLRAAKAELIELLSAPSDPVPSIDDYQPAPEEWTAAFADLDRDSSPVGLSAERWRTFVDDVEAFLSSVRCDFAIYCGWTAGDLFGGSDDEPFSQIHPGGLLMKANGGRLLAIDRTKACIETLAGARGSAERRSAARRGNSQNDAEA